MRSVVKRGGSVTSCSRISTSGLCFLDCFFFFCQTPSRHPAGRSGNIPGRVKRVVSCKRKTHHLMVARRRQTGSGRSSDVANKENEADGTQGVRQHTLDTDHWDSDLNVNKKRGADESSAEQDDCSALTEVRNTLTALAVVVSQGLSFDLCPPPTPPPPPFWLQLTRDHRTLIDVLYGRNLRLKVSLTLWKRSIGELLTYLLRCFKCQMSSHRSLSWM